jgi:hypothetical protein
MILMEKNNLIEQKIRNLVREIIAESLILEISAEEKAKVMAKSNERVPFNTELMKQAIEQGREIGINYRSKNDKYEMPTIKSRIIHPVAMGTDKNGNIVIRGLHITGQSEKAARETGIRSAEVEAEKDGMNAWRLFKADNLKAMWFTGRFFSDDIPGYNPNDKAMTTKIVTYSPTDAKKYQDELVAQSKAAAQIQEPSQQTQNQPSPQPAQPTQVAQPRVGDKDIEQVGYENQPIQEKQKNIRGLFK